MPEWPGEELGPEVHGRVSRAVRTACPEAKAVAPEGPVALGVKRTALGVSWQDFRL